VIYVECIDRVVYTQTMHAALTHWRIILFHSIV